MFVKLHISLLGRSCPLCGFFFLRKNIQKIESRAKLLEKEYAVHLITVSIRSKQTNKQNKCF